MTISDVIPTQSSSGATVRYDNISRWFHGTGIVIDGVSFRVEPGEFVALLGPSGCGKSSLLRLTAGLDSPDAGNLIVETNARPLSRSFVFQEPTLLPWRSVLRNTTLPLELQGWKLADAQPRAHEELRRVELDAFAPRYPHELSGGMKMRASVARALITAPNLLLLDEPFAALHEPARHGLQIRLRQIWTNLQMTILFVTHSVTEAVFISDRIIVLSQRPARVLLDRPIPLGSARTPELRTSVQYVEQVRQISQAVTVAEKDT